MVFSDSFFLLKFIPYSSLCWRCLHFKHKRKSIYGPEFRKQISKEAKKNEKWSERKTKTRKIWMRGMWPNLSVQHLCVFLFECESVRVCVHEYLSMFRRYCFKMVLMEKITIWHATHAEYVWVCVCACVCWLWLGRDKLLDKVTGVTLNKKKYTKALFFQPLLAQYIFTTIQLAQKRASAQTIHRDKKQTKRASERACKREYKIV